MGRIPKEGEGIGGGRGGVGVEFKQKRKARVVELDTAVRIGYNISEENSKENRGKKGKEWKRSTM